MLSDRVDIAECHIEARNMHDAMNGKCIFRLSPFCRCCRCCCGLATTLSAARRTTEQSRKRRPDDDRQGERVRQTFMFRVKTLNFAH